MAHISKAEFVAQLEELLKNADIHVKGLELRGDDIVVIYFDNHRARVINIDGDGYVTIALAVIQRAVYP